MALDGILLSKIITQLQDITPTRINKIAQISQNELVFECYHKQKNTLVFSIDSNTNRLNVTTQKMVKLDQPSHFVMLLRKHLENGWINNIKQIELDRVVEISITNTDWLGDKVEFRLMVELMGKYANVILVGQDNRILDAFNRIAPYENSNRIIFSGAEYSYPERPKKLNPFINDDYTLESSLVKQFDGFSPLLAREVEFRLYNGEDFKDIMNQIKESQKLFVSNNYQFHVIPLTHLGEVVNTYPILSGLEDIYHQQVTQARITQHTGNLLKTVKRELKKAQSKKEKLTLQKVQAQDYQQFQTIGDILMTYGIQLDKGLKTTTLTDFENNPVTIELDPKLNGLENAKKYYSKYRKLKTSIHYLDEQLQINQNEIEYFEGLLHQIEEADVSTAYQIQEELVKHGVLRKHKQGQKDKKTKIKVNEVMFDDVTFYYGLTNIQNDYLTFKQARKNQSWFHILDSAGSHVVCELPLEQLNERLIRFGANLAAYHSKYKESSSVAVAYTSVAQLKKIPKAPLGKVSMTQYTTIYIDPMDPSLLGDSLDQIGTVRDKSALSDSSQIDERPHEQ